MTQEEKEILIKDLCGRLPYGVKAYIKNWSKLDRKYYEGVYTVGSVHPSLNDIYGYKENGSVEVILGYSDYDIKPYLFPLSSMTDEQREEIEDKLIFPSNSNGGWVEILHNDKYNIPFWFIDFCNKNHFDYRGLIEKRLALDATGLNIY